MLSIRESKWNYNTSATAGLGVELLSMSGGRIVIDDPEKQAQGFSYSGFRFGLVNIPIPKIHLPPLPALNREISGTGSVEDFYSNGYLYMTDSFHGKELTKSDIQSGTVYLDAGTGFLAGYGLSVMLLGINAALLMPWLVNPGLFSNLASNAIKSAPALLFMHGESEGLIASIGGVSAMIGYLH
ncbi:hypothetical protein [Paraburkholderia sp. SIMBA_030]|uniref:hypothetical protein n=1 Tax=Paraburkholderia sp. SIMBA_030 TaxID=3085773 RepID=UPI00397B78E0